jgi:hypothetical protein
MELYIIAAFLLDILNRLVTLPSALHSTLNKYMDVGGGVAAVLWAYIEKITNTIIRFIETTKDLTFTFRVERGTTDRNAVTYNGSSIGVESPPPASFSEQ